MATVGLKCPECGSSNVVDDALYSQTQLVCEDCGSVVSEGLLTTDRYEDCQGTDVRYSQSTGVDKQPCRNQIKGLQRVRVVCRILRLNYDMEEMVETLYKRAYEHPSYIRVSLQKKEALVGCCVLVTCRQRNRPVALGTICGLLEADPMLLGVMYTEMVNTLNIEVPSTMTTDLLEAHCQEYKISALHVPEPLSEQDSRALTERAEALLELAADTWIVAGRQPVPMMMACVYVAWQSLRHTQIRLKFSLDKFCKLAKMTKSKIAPTRITELKEVLCKLGQEMPWLMVDLTHENVIQHVCDILKNRKALMWRAMMTHEEALLHELDPSPDDACPGGQTTIPSPTGDTAQPCLEVVCAPVAVEETVVEEESLPPNKTDTRGASPPGTDWRKRHLFLPPCVWKKRRRVERPMLEVTGDEEISDSEIEMYIRTPQEIRAFADANEILSAVEEEK